MKNKTYKVQEMFQWFSQFNGKQIRIQGETKIFDIELNESTLPHLLGIHYVNKNYRDNKAMEVYRHIQEKNLSDQEIYRKIEKNNPDKLKSVKQRINTLQKFLENIEKGYIVEQTKPKTNIKSNYLVIRSEDNTFFHLGIHQSKSTYLETYFVQNNMNYFEDSQIIESIIGLYQYNEKTLSFEPFSFHQKEHILEKEGRTMNLYQYFGCKNKEELYHLVEIKDPSVRELRDFMGYAQGQILSQEGLKNKKDMVKYLGSVELPQKNEFSIFFLNAGNQILSYNTFPYETELPEVIEKSYHPTAVQFCIVSGSENLNRCENLCRDLEGLRYRILDRMYMRKNKIYSVDLEPGEVIRAVSEEKENTFPFSETFTDISNIPNMEKYQEFIEFYRDQQLPGKNVIVNHREIEKLLKLSNQHLSQEYFSIIAYDKDHKITNYETLFKGKIDSSPVDLRIVIPYLLEENIRGIQILHNHPSGNPKPSREDIELTRNIELLCKKFNKELLDHTIIGKEDTFSFQREGMLYQNVLAQGVAEINETRKMIEALKDDVENLQYANDDMKGNKEIATFIIPENPRALQHMTEEIKSDKELVLQAIQKDGKVFEYASETLRGDKDVAYEALKQDKANVLYLGDNIGKKIQEEKDLETFLQEYEKEKEKQLEEVKQIKTKTDTLYQKEGQMEYNKLYAYQDKELITIEELSKEGYKNIIEKYKEREENKAKFEVFGLTDKNELYLDIIDETKNNIEEAYSEFEKTELQQGNDKYFLEFIVKEIDKKHDIGLEKLIHERKEKIVKKEGQEIIQQTIESKKEVKKNEKIVGLSNSQKEGQKIMQEIMEEAKISKPPKYKEERDKFVESLIQSLEEGKIPWERDWESTASIIHNPVSQTKYQGRNAFKLAVTSFKKGYADPRWVTFKQAQQAGWKVKKGEKATTIEIYQKYDKATKKEFNEKVLEGMSYAEKNKYVKENVYFFIKTHNVFNGQQLEGIAPFKEEKREVKYEKIDKILQNSKIPIQYLGDKAFYEHTTDSITLPEKENFKSENRFYGTALHELSHSTGHKDRLNRDIDAKFGSKKYAREELVAEFSSVFIGQQLGLNYDKEMLNNSKAYLQNWAKQLKADKNLLYGAIKDAEIASKSIIEMQTKEGPEIFKQYNQEKQFLKGKEVEKENEMER